MKNLIKTFIGLVIFCCISINLSGQNQNKYSGRFSFDGNDYDYETSCAGEKDLMTGNIETYQVTIWKVKKEKRKQILKTHCFALEVKKKHSDVKKNFDQIRFTTVNEKGLAPEIEGTSKKITLEFYFDNFTLKPQFGNNTPMGCASFEEGIKAVMLFVMKELD